MSTITGKDLITIDAAAAEFKISRAVIFKYLRLGKLQRWAGAMDRKTYVRHEELTQLLKPKVVKAKRGLPHYR